MTTITNLELPRHLEGSDVTWTKLQKSSGATFMLDIAQHEPSSSAWMPPAMDPLRVWPCQYDPVVENPAWASDPLGQWGGIKPYQKGIKRDTGMDPAAFNYGYMALHDVIPCGQISPGVLRYEPRNEADLEARKRNYYAALAFIHRYPKYEDMESTIGVSDYLFVTQVGPAIYDMRAHAHFMDMELRHWDYNHTADFQERILWSVDGYPVEVRTRLPPWYLSDHRAALTLSGMPGRCVPPRTASCASSPSLASTRRTSSRATWE